MIVRCQAENGQTVEVFENGEGEDGDRYYGFDYVDGDDGTFKERIRDVTKYVATDEWKPLD